MSSKAKARRDSHRSVGKGRRALQLVQQRLLLRRLREARPELQDGRELPDKEQQTSHNAVTDGVPFGLFTSDQ